MPCSSRLLLQEIKEIHSWKMEADSMFGQRMLQSQLRIILKSDETPRSFRKIRCRRPPSLGQQPFSTLLQSKHSEKAPDFNFRPSSALSAKSRPKKTRQRRLLRCLLEGPIRKCSRGKIESRSKYVHTSVIGMKSELTNINLTSGAMSL